MHEPHTHGHYHRRQRRLHSHEHGYEHQHSYLKDGLPDDLEWHPERRFLYDGDRLRQLLQLSIKRAQARKEAEYE